MQLLGRKILTPQSIAAWGIAGAGMYAWYKYDQSQNAVVFTKIEQKDWNHKVKSSSSNKDKNSE